MNWILIISVRCGIALLSICVVISSLMSILGTAQHAPLLTLYATDRTGKYHVYEFDPAWLTIFSRIEATTSIYHFAWSPSGDRLAYSARRDNSNRTDLWLTDASGREHQRLTDSDTFDSGVIWQADEQGLYYIRKRLPVNLSEIYHLDLTTGATEKQMAFNGDIASLIWQNADRFIFHAAADVPVKWDIFSVQTDGTGLINLTDDVDLYASYPALSPDGQSLAYVQGDSSVILRSLTTEAEPQVLFRCPRGIFWGITWSTTHNLIAGLGQFCNINDLRPRLYLYDVTTGQTRAIPFGANGAGGLAWRP